MKGTHLGEFQEVILLLVGIEYESAYGVGILRALKEHTGRTTRISAIHTVLSRLEEKGYLTSEIGGATQKRGGRRKRLYRITAAGREALIERRYTRDHLWELSPDLTLRVT